MKHVWKRLMAALLSLALLLPMLGVAESTTVYGVCTADDVRVRKQPNGTGVWFYVDEGHVAEIIGEVTDSDGNVTWYKVNTTHPEPNGHTYIGYIHADYFRPLTQEEDVIPAPSDDPTQEPAEEPTQRPSTEDAVGGDSGYDGIEVIGAKGRTLGGTNFRNAPSTATGKIISEIPRNTVIDILAVPAAGGEWYCVAYNGTVGYVHSGMIKLLEAGATATPDPSLGTEVTNTWGVITADGVRFRYGPSSEQAAILQFEEGTEVEVLTIPAQIGSKYWYRIRYNGTVGYVQSNYVRITSGGVTEEPSSAPEDEEGTDVIGATGEITADGVNFRLGAGLDYGTMGKLNSGTVVELLTIPDKIDSEHWYRVRYNGLEGYIQANFIRVLTLDESYLPDASKYGYAKLVEDSANLRSTPAGSTVLQWRGEGSLLQIVGEAQRKNSYDWYPVYYSMHSAIYYVREDLIEVVLIENGEVVTPTPDPESPYGYVITTTYGVNLRLKPSGDSIVQIPRNTILTCVGDPVKPEGSQYWWYYVKYDGMHGYLRGDCVRVCTATGGSVSATPTPKPTDGPVEDGTIYGYIRLTTYGVNLRDAPLGNSQVQLPKGLILPMIAPVVPKDAYGRYCWYKVRTADGLTGYIRGDCAVECDPEGDEIPSTPTPTPSDAPELTGATGVMLKNTNFREGASTSSTIMTVIKAGTVVEVLSIPKDTDNGWYKIRYNGKPGYVHASLLQMLTYGEEGAPTEKPSAYGYVMITGSGVNLRDEVEGDTLTQLNKGTVWPMTGVMVTKNGVNWYPIRANGHSGYVHGSYAFKLSPAQEESYLNGNGVPEETPAPETVLSSYLIVTGDKVRLRESYSLDAAIAYQVDKNTVLQYIGSRDVGTVTWYNVVYEGRELWIHEDYSRIMTVAEYQDWLAENPDAEPDVTQNLGYLKIVKDYVPIRSTANGKTILVTLRTDTVIRYYAQNISAGGYQWYRVLTPDGEYGYVCADLVEKCDQYGDALPTTPPNLGDYSNATQTQQETDYSTLKLGSSGAKVTNLVTELINQGYYKGSVTSSYTSAVQSAVKAFQTVNGLTVDGIAGDQTQHKLFGTVPIGSGNTSDLSFEFFPVEKIDWYTGGIQQLIPRGANFKVYDVKTGIVWWAHRWAGSRHADIETLTAADSARLCQIYGVDNLQEIVDDNMWERRPCLITIGTRTFAASLDGMQHGTDTIANNNMDGQICLHFTNSEGHASQSVSTSHKQAIEYAYNNCPAGQK